MKKIVKYSLVLLSGTGMSHGAIIYNLADQSPGNAATTSAGGATSFVVLNQVGLGTPIYSITYRVTADLTSLGDSAAATFDFTATYAATGGNMVGGNMGIDGASGGASRFYAGEIITASLAAGPSSGGSFILDGFVNLQAYTGAERIVVTSDTVNTDTLVANPVTSFASGGNFASTFTLSAPGDGIPAGDGATLGFVTYRVTAIPEPSSAALLGLGGLALILRRRK